MMNFNFLLNVRKTDFNFSVIYTQKLKHTLLTIEPKSPRLGSESTVLRLYHLFCK